MTEPARSNAVAPERLNLPYIGIIGLACGLVAPFTGLAWPFAMLTGFVIGRSDAERILGIKQPALVTIIRVLAVTGGVLAMLFFGAILGGLIGFVIVALVDFEERLTARAASSDQMIARIALFVLTMITWLVLINLLHVNVSIGG